MLNADRDGECCSAFFAFARMFDLCHMHLLCVPCVAA